MLLIEGVLGGTVDKTEASRWRSGKKKKKKICLPIQETQEMLVRSWVGKIPWRRKWQPTPVFLPGESQGQRSLVGCRLWGHTESDMTEVT